MTLDTLISIDLFTPGSYWELKTGVNGYQSSTGGALATQAPSGRSFELLEAPKSLFLKGRVLVRLLEDGYKCWLDIEVLSGKVVKRGFWRPTLLSRREINKRLPAVLNWVRTAAAQKNNYLWGGTLGPDFDCSGLVQSAFASEGIWLPRDAYQQEKFCSKVQFNPDKLQDLLLGDLIFFGSEERCTHVAIHEGGGFYWHSSGKERGRDGIGRDGLSFSDTRPVACNYRGQVRGVGRVNRCHDGTSLL